jgi:hypothetical protein
VEPNIVAILATAATTSVPVVLTSIVGFVKLRTRFEEYARHNEKSLARIEDALCKQNGQIDTNTTDIARIKGVCHERHKAD